jgi:hypothetical protein
LEYLRLLWECCESTVLSSRSLECSLGPIHTHTHAHTNAHAQTYARTHTHAHTHTYEHTYAHAHTDGTGRPPRPPRAAPHVAQRPRRDGDGGHQGVAGRAVCAQALLLLAAQRRRGDAPPPPPPLSFAPCVHVVAECVRVIAACVPLFATCVPLFAACVPPIIIKIAKCAPFTDHRIDLFTPFTQIEVPDGREDLHSELDFVFPKAHRKPQRPTHSHTHAQEHSYKGTR